MGLYDAALQCCSVRRALVQRARGSWRGSCNLWRGRHWCVQCNTGCFATAMLCVALCLLCSQLCSVVCCLLGVLCCAAALAVHLHLQWVFRCCATADLFTNIDLWIPGFTWCACLITALCQLFPHFGMAGLVCARCEGRVLLTKRQLHAKTLAAVPTTNMLHIAALLQTEVFNVLTKSILAF